MLKMLLMLELRIEDLKTRALQLQPKYYDDGYYHDDGYDSCFDSAEGQAERAAEKAFQFEQTAAAEALEQAEFQFEQTAAAEETACHLQAPGVEFLHRLFGALLDPDSLTINVDPRDPELRHASISNCMQNGVYRLRSRLTEVFKTAWKPQWNVLLDGKSPKSSSISWSQLLKSKVVTACAPTFVAKDAARCTVEVIGNCSWHVPAAWSTGEVVSMLKMLELRIEQLDRMSASPATPWWTTELETELKDPFDEFITRVFAGHVNSSQMVLEIMPERSRISTSMQQSVAKLSARLEKLSVRESVPNFLKDECSKCGNLQIQLDLIKESRAEQDEFFHYVKQEKKRLEQQNNLLEEQLMQSTKQQREMEDKNRQLELDLTKMTERCSQQQQVLESMRVETVRLRGELSDVTKGLATLATSSGGWPGGAIGVTHGSSQVESEPGVDTISEAVSWVCVEAERVPTSSSERPSDVASDAGCSCVSVNTSLTHCFMSDTIFQSMSGENQFFLPASLLQKGSVVVSEDNTTLIEVASAPEVYQTDRVVELRASDATLVVTPDHRIPVLDEECGKRMDVEASNLEHGSIVFVNGVPTRLSSVTQKELAAKVNVLKIAFKPDLPVGVFSRPRAIASKGSKKKTIRRGMPRKGRDGVDVAESIPDTAPGEYQD